MVAKKKVSKKAAKKTAKKVSKRKVETEEEDEEGGMSLDDAFADDDDVEYAEAKPRKVKKVVKEERVFSSGGDEEDNIKIKASKPVGKLVRGDKVTVDGLVLEVDAQVEMMDHGSTKEMAIECFDPVKDKDYEIRYFSDQVETSMEVYVLEEIIYNKMKVRRVEW